MDHSLIPDKGRLVGNPQQTGGPRVSEVQTPSRITVLEHVAYNTKSGQPYIIQSRYNRNQMTEEQPFKRIITIGGEWTRMDYGWINVCGMLVISNEEGKVRQRILSPDDKLKVNSRILEVYFGRPKSKIITAAPLPTEPADQHSRRVDPEPQEIEVDIPPYPMLLLPPGESQRYTPANVKNVWLRCQSETCKITINLIPG